MTKQVSCVELVNRQIKECEAANDHCQVSAHHDADARRARWDEGAVAAPECASSLGEKAMDGSINCDANVDWRKQNAPARQGVRRQCVEISGSGSSLSTCIAAPPAEMQLAHGTQKRGNSALCDFRAPAIKVLNAGHGNHVGLSCKKAWPCLQYLSWRETRHRTTITNDISPV